MGKSATGPKMRNQPTGSNRQATARTEADQVDESQVPWLATLLDH